MNTLLILITLCSMFLVVYHHLIYPILLKIIANFNRPESIDFYSRNYDSKSDKKLPSICIVIPAYNEAEWIAEKITNLAFLDYPHSLLKVVLACDGCSDNTANIARQCLLKPECSHLNLEIREFQENLGKVAILNSVLKNIDADLVALTDVSALISVDALMIAVAHFKDPRVGVLNSHYQLLNPGSVGESSYWNYQSRIKSSEALLGSTLGAHGAFYMFRQHLFEYLDDDTINDDFVLPMTIVSKGYKAAQDNRIHAVELEKSHAEMDQKRRLRISAGNVQQLMKLKHLLLPKYRGVAFAFASGKALRVTMPFLMIIALAGSCILYKQHALFSVAAISQLIIYGLAYWGLKTHYLNDNRFIKTLCYILNGHLAGFVGSIQYLFKKHNGPWRKV